MDFLALTSWIAAATLGSYMLTRSVTASRNAAGATVSDLPPTIAFLHPSSAILGIVVYGVFMANHQQLYAWVALGILITTALLGELMFSAWLKGKRRRRSPMTPTPAEQFIPIEVVAAHGLFAGLTIVLVLITALRA